MISVSFYNVPTIRKDHREVIVDMRTYLHNRGALFTRQVKTFQPTFRPFFLTITPPAPAVLPTYATFTADGIEWGCFVDFPDALTGNAVNVEMTPDWWYIYVDGEPSEADPASSIGVTGAIMQTTAWRSGGGMGLPKDAAYAIPPDFHDELVRPVPRASVTGYRLTANLLCSSVATPTTNTVQTSFWVTFPNIRDALTIAGSLEILAGAKQFRDAGGTVYGILSISNVQIIPAEFPVGVGVAGSADKAGAICMNPTAQTPVWDNVLYMRAEWYDNISGDYTFLAPPSYRGTPRAVVEVGNYVKRIRLTDAPERTSVRVRTAFAGDRMRILIGTCDGWEDMTDCTMVPYAYTDAGGITASNRSADALQLLSAGVTLAGSIGTAAATGGAAAPAVVPAALGAASTLIQQRTRATSVHSSVASGFFRNVTDFSVIGFAILTPGNGSQRELDALVHGCTGSAAYPTANILAILRSYNLDEYGYEFIRFAPDVMLRVLPVMPTPNTVSRPTPPLDVVEDIRATLAAGIGFWMDGYGGGWAGWQYVGDMRRVYTGRASSL